jgi:dimethylsulfone monooxygenase
MKFGFYVPGQVTTVGSPEIAQSIEEALSPLPPGRRDAQFGFAEEIVMAADESGFDLALYAERHMGADLCAWVLAGALASRMKNMRALVAAHPGLWSPAMIAKLAASIDRICVNRMAINIVNGWYEEEFRTFGGDVLEGEARYRRSGEFVELLRRLWREETVTHHSEFYDLDRARLMLKPASPEPPPIYSVSNTDQGREFIAQHCDFWFVGMPKDPEASQDDVLRAVERSIEAMNRRCRELGRTMQYGLNPFVAVADSVETALEQSVQKIFAYDKDPGSRSPDRTRQIERRMLPATKAGLMGRPADIRRQVERFEAMGVDMLLVKFIPTVENVKRIGAEVIAA